MYSYSPGSWFGLLTPAAAVIVPGSLGADAARAVHRAVTSGGGFPAILDALATASGGSFTHLPDFGVAVQEGSRLRIAVRGGVEARAAGEAISGADVSTWTERVVDADAGVELRVPGARHDALGMLPAVDAMVLCDIVVVGAVAEAAPSAVAPAIAVSPEEPKRAPAAVVEPSVPVDDFATLVPEATIAEPPTEAAAAEQVSAPEAVSETPAVAPPSPPAAAAPADASDDYDDLFGATVIRVVEDAAVRTDDEEVAHGAAGGPAVSAPVTIATSLPPAAPQASAAPPNDAGADVMISGIPTHLTGEPPARPATPAAAPVEGGEGDHDGMTVSLAQIRAMRQQGGAAPAPVAAAVPTAVAGTARVSTGEAVTLDRSVIIGRKPKSTRPTGDVPHLVTVPSPDQDISRSHLELRVEGSAVLAVDLNTTNGTVLKRQGKDPVRLHPMEAAILLDGDVLDLGEGVSVTLEGLR